MQFNVRVHTSGRGKLWLEVLDDCDLKVGDYATLTLARDVERIAKLETEVLQLQKGVVLLRSADSVGVHQCGRCGIVTSFSLPRVPKYSLPRVPKYGEVCYHCYEAVLSSGEVDGRE